MKKGNDFMLRIGTFLILSSGEAKQYLRKLGLDRIMLIFHVIGSHLHLTESGIVYIYVIGSPI